MTWSLYSLVVLILAGGALLFVVAYASGIIGEHENDDATLTCFHCGRDTDVGRRRCQWCRKELQ